VKFAIVTLANGRPASHTIELMQLFDAVQVNDIYENATFDERIAQLRKTQRQKRREQAAVANVYA
jgi:hypothetical protein